MCEHSGQALVFPRNGELVHVDIELIPLIQELWRQELWIICCCQSNPDEHWIWLMFHESAIAKQFLNRIGGKYDSDDINCLQSHILFDTMDDEDGWQYSIHLNNNGLTETIDSTDTYIDIEQTGPNDFEFLISIRFPRSHLTEVLRRLKAARHKLMVVPPV